MTQQHHDVAAFLAAAGVRTNPAVPGRPLAAGPDAACRQKFCHFEEGGLHCESSRLPSAGVDTCRLLSAACMPHGAPGCRKRENNGLEVPSLSEFNDSTPLILSTPSTPSTHQHIDSLTTRRLDDSTTRQLDNSTTDSLTAGLPCLPRKSFKK
jgi:hypothetical protein